MPFELAQVNIARLAAALEDPRLADFVTALDPVNAVAERAPGFVWRLQTEDGNATAIHAFEWDAADSAGIITNMSVWTGGKPRDVRLRRAPSPGAEATPRVVRADSRGLHGVLVGARRSTSDDR